MTSLIPIISIDIILLKINKRELMEATSISGSVRHTPIESGAGAERPRENLNGRTVTHYHRQDNGAASIFMIAGACLMMLALIRLDICRVNRDCNQNDMHGIIATAASGVTLIATVLCCAIR
jgi:hypothetical protein